MRRSALVLVAAALVVVPLGPASAQTPVRVFEASARGAVTMADLDVQPAFDPAWADSRSSSSTIGATSLQSSVWPSFLADAFFFLYGFQSVERIALGIAEARYPQGPTEVDATQSDLLFLNGGDPNAVPGRFGRAYARADDRDARGDVATGTIQFPALGAVGSSTSSSRAVTVDVAAAAATQDATDLIFGPVRIEAVRGKAWARTSPVPSADATLRIVGATVAGVEVAIDDEGARADSAALQDVVDTALAGSGITLRRLPAEIVVGDEGARADSGGLLVVLERRVEDPVNGSRDVTIGFLFGATSASARAVSAPGGGTGTQGPEEPAPRTITEFVTVPGTPGVAGTSAVRPTIVRRTVVTSASGLPAGARGAYGAVVLLALGLLGIRPFVRAAARA